jgi:uncharacterized protein
MNPRNSGPSLSEPLTDADVEELDELLASIQEDRDPLDVAMLDGYLVGVLLQPEAVLPSAWLPRVFDVDGREIEWPDEATFERTLALTMRRHNELAAYIVAREPFEPVIFELLDDAGQELAGRAAIEALAPWAQGFLFALETFPGLAQRLEAEAEAGRGTGATFAILRHLPDDPEDTSAEAVEERAMRAEMEQDMPPPADLDEAIDELVAAVMEIADVARPRRPIERAGPKVGRIDPCPCGSGRKYKNCHGGGAH